MKKLFLLFFMIFAAVLYSWNDNKIRISVSNDVHVLRWNLDTLGYDSSLIYLGKGVAGANSWGSNAYLSLGDMCTRPWDTIEIKRAWDTLSTFSNTWFGIIGNHDLDEKTYAWCDDTFHYNFTTGTYAPHIKTDTVLSSDGSISFRIFQFDQNYYGGQYITAIPGKNIGDRIGMNQYTYDSGWAPKYMITDAQLKWMMDTLRADNSSDGIVLVMHVGPLGGQLAFCQYLADSLRKDGRPVVGINGHDHIMNRSRLYTSDSSQCYSFYIPPSIQTYFAWERFLFGLDGTVLKPEYITLKNFRDTTGLNPQKAPFKILSEAAESLYITNTPHYDTLLTLGQDTLATIWSSGTYPLPTDTVLMDAVQTGHDTMAAKSYFDVAKIIITADNARNHYWAGTNNYTKYGFSHDGTGVITLGNMLYNTISGIIHFGSGIGTPVASLCTLRLAGSATLDVDKSMTFSQLMLDRKTTVTASGAAGTLTISNQNSKCIVIGDSSTLTLNQWTQLSPQKSGALFAFGKGITFNGTGGWSIKPNGNNLIITIPEVTFTGTGGVYFTDWGGTNYDGYLSFTGNQNYGANAFYTYTTTAGAECGVRLSNNTFTCGIWYIGATAGTWKLVGGTATVNCSSLNGTTYNGGTPIDSLQTMTINCSGNWLMGSNHTVVEDSSLVNMSGGTTAIISHQNKFFHDFSITKTGSVVDSLGAGTRLIVHGTLDINSGKFKQKLDTIDVWSLIIGGTDSCFFDAPIEIDGNLTIETGAIPVWQTGRNVIFTDTGAHTIALAGYTVPRCSLATRTTINGGGTFDTLKMANGVKLTLEEGKKLTFTTVDSAGLSGVTDSPDSIVSSSPTVKCTLDIPNGRHNLSNLYFKNVVLPAGDTINCPWRSGCRSGGGNY